MIAKISWFCTGAYVRGGFAVQINLENADPRLKPGMPAGAVR